MNQVVNDMTRMKLMDKFGVLSIAVDMSGVHGMVPEMELTRAMFSTLLRNWTKKTFSFISEKTMAKSNFQSKWIIANDVIELDK